MNSYKINESCCCGKEHKADIGEIIIGKGAVGRVGEAVKKYSCMKPFVLADVNTFEAAGKAVCGVLDGENIAYSKYVYPDKRLKPDERAVGSAVMHFDHSCDIIIAVGSGVINDIGKILSRLTDKKYIIVATAPSVDGYASGTSSMDRDGFKLSLDSRCPDVIIGDVDILKNAPLHMLKSGLGDMLAKYVSIAEWRIGQLVIGEYYCEQVAQLVRTALKKCTDNASGLLRRDEAAVEAMFEGLVISGLAMAYAGISRPASGVEHYFSHIWDMRGLEFSTPVDLHGIQCAMGTHRAVEIYEKLKKITPDKEKALRYVKSFDYDAWKLQLSALLGRGADAMIEQEKTERKYSKSTHEKRLEKIIDNWGEILEILDEELPSFKELDELMTKLEMPIDFMSIGVDEDLAKKTFLATKDIRDKYILSRLAWDMGVVEEL